MSKFGDLLDENIPVLLVFNRQDEASVDLNPVLKDVAAALGDKGKVIKIDVDKNQTLANKYSVRGVPTLILFKKGEIVWRQSGVVDGKSLIKKIEENIQSITTTFIEKVETVLAEKEKDIMTV